MNILVTGGAGFIGSHMALALHKAGHRVRVADNFDPYYSPALKRRNARLLTAEKILIHQLDLAVDPLEPILEHTDLVLHLAAQPGNNADTPYFTYIKNNFHATVALVETLKNTSTKFIHISTSSVYGKDACGDENTLPAPVSPYGVTKLAAEAAVLSAARRKELQACVLRYFSVYGERERPDKLFPRLFSCLKHGNPFPLYKGSLEHERSFSYVGDIVQGTLAAVRQIDSDPSKVVGEVFNIGSDQCFTTANALELAQEISGKKLNINHLPPRPGDQLATKANIGKARKTLGFSPQTTLKEGLTRVWAWAQKEL